METNLITAKEAANITNKYFEDRIDYRWIKRINDSIVSNASIGSNKTIININNYPETLRENLLLYLRDRGYRRQILYSLNGDVDLIIEWDVTK